MISKCKDLHRVPHQKLGHLGCTEFLNSDLAPRELSDSYLTFTALKRHRSDQWNDNLDSAWGHRISGWFKKAFSSNVSPNRSWRRSVVMNLDKLSQKFHSNSIQTAPEGVNRHNHLYLHQYHLLHRIILKWIREKIQYNRALTNAEESSPLVPFTSFRLTLWS